MPILLTTGDLFQSGAQVFVNAVNCVGIMGNGIALEFKKRFPKMHSVYVKVCRQNLIRPGKIWIWHEDSPGCCQTGIASVPPHYILNFPTKDDWKNPSELAWIAAGLDDLRYHATILNMVSIALPALGCGKGGLSFVDVRALVEEKLGNLTAAVSLYEPHQ